MSAVKVYEPATGTSIDTFVDPATGFNQQIVRVTGNLTSRMFAKTPLDDYSLYLDTADVTYIYIAEGPTADTAASTTAQGIRVTKDALGNPLGRVSVATGFAWNSRAAAGWV